MGLFGSRKKAKNVPVTSVTERSQNPEEIKEEDFFRAATTKS